MSKRRQCPRCGAYLDAEEQCDCEKEVNYEKERLE